MNNGERGILIIDEDGFSRVCTAMLKKEGYRTIIPVSLAEAKGYISSVDISLIILSYSYAGEILEEGVIGDIPTLVLVEQLSEDVMGALMKLKKGICMLKPVDFERFRSIIRRIINGEINLSGSNIIA